MVRKCFPLFSLFDTGIPGIIDHISDSEDYHTNVCRKLRTGNADDAIRVVPQKKSGLHYDVGVPAYRLRFCPGRSVKAQDVCLTSNPLQAYEGFRCKQLLQQYTRSDAHVSSPKTSNNTRTRANKKERKS